MLNIIIKRFTVSVSILWCLIMLVLAWINPELAFPGFAIIFGAIPAIVVIGIAYLLCWIIGPAGKFGDHVKGD